MRENWILRSNRVYDKLDWIKLPIIMVFMVGSMGVDHLYLGDKYIVFASFAFLFVLWRMLGIVYGDRAKKVRIENDLDKFEVDQARLIKDIELDKITFKEASERCTKLWKLIPSNYTVSPFRLTDLMKEKYGDDPEWGNEIITYHIPIGEDLTPEEVSKLIKKFRYE